MSDKTRTKKFNEGDIIFKEGEYGNTFYIIKSGSVDVVKGLGEEGEIVIARLGKNEIFGEMAIFGDKLRSATIRAAEDLEVTEVSENVIKYKMPSSPEWVKTMFEVLVKRLKETNKKIKGHFKLGVGLSLYNLLSLILYKHGKKTHEGIELKFDDTIKRITQIIGVSKTDIEKLLAELKFINVIRFSKSKNEITITDEKKFSEFLEFSSKAVETKDLIPEGFENLSNDEKKKITYYKELLKILMRNYPDIFIIT
ncbi:Crp/Fnr family transcriptional regulator [candidate division KSB1 bacterium]